jgi:hypothetical protein
MRVMIVFSVLILAGIGWGAYANGEAPPSLAAGRLTLIPTAMEELRELRMNTGRKAVLGDGTMNTVYVTKNPAGGSTYLNFHVDVASGGGPFSLHPTDICLQGATPPAANLRAAFVKGESASRSTGTVTYTPFDCFIDTGSAEVRGDPLPMPGKAIVQFTIEVPRDGLDDLILYVQAQRVGTVREIRDRIERERGRN